MSEKDEHNSNVTLIEEDEESISLEKIAELTSRLTTTRSRRSRPSIHSLPSETARQNEKELGRLSLSTASSGGSADSFKPRKVSFSSGPSDTVSDDVSFNEVHYTVSAPTTHALTDFSKFIARKQEDEEQADERRDIAARSAPTRYNQNKVLERLRNAMKDQKMTSTGSFGQWLASGMGRHQPKMPNDHELLSLIWHWLPPRPQLHVVVCDFGHNRFEKHDITIGEMEKFFQNKPDWCQVRWIHAPLGLGLFHSSVEDIFLKSGCAQPGKPFAKSGRPGFPFLETDVLNFRAKTEVRALRDVKKLYWEKRLKKALDDSVFNGNKNLVLQPDVEWRAGHLNTEASFWNSIMSDVPSQMADTLSVGLTGPLSVIRDPDEDDEDQIIGKHEFFEDAHLVVDPFRLFHRKDGYVLSLSSCKGINYLDAYFDEHLSQPSDLMMENRQASVLGQVIDEFKETGTATWHKATIEWFVVYVFTELLTTPHNLRSGLAAPAMLEAYQALIRQMKRNRFRPWERNETARLVHQQLACADELSVISLLLQDKIELLKGLERDVRAFQSSDRRHKIEPSNQTGSSMLERVEWARLMLDAIRQDVDHLSSELRQSMTTLFQLRSIEQNELAIAADIQNKAVIVFASVTVIFLPLSFFTSYYGMNLQGIQNSSHNEQYFWRVCGSISLAIVACVGLYAFRHRVKRYTKFGVAPVQHNFLHHGHDIKLRKM